MNVTQYTFQSPYSSPFQVGRPGPTQKVGTTQQGDAELTKNTNTSLASAQSFQATQIKEVTPTVDSKPLLDIYA